METDRTAADKTAVFHLLLARLRRHAVAIPAGSSIAESCALLCNPPTMRVKTKVKALISKFAFKLQIGKPVEQLQTETLLFTCCFIARKLKGLQGSLYFRFERARNISSAWPCRTTSAAHPAANTE
jgi:hypothetical protein